MTEPLKKDGTSVDASQVADVVIGRNEGDRLVRGLHH